MDILAKQKFTNILIIILVIINIGSLSFIWFREFNRPKLPPPSPGRENVNRFLDNELNLSQEQKQKFKDIRREHFETTRKFEDKVSEYKREVLSESFNQKPDKQKITVLIDSIGSAQKAYELFLSEHFQKLASICTPGQRDKLKDIFLNSFRPKDRPPLPPPGREPER